MEASTATTTSSIATTSSSTSTSQPPPPSTVSSNAQAPHILPPPKLFHKCSLLQYLIRSRPWATKLILYMLEKSPNIDHIDANNHSTLWYAMTYSVDQIIIDKIVNKIAILQQKQQQDQRQHQQQHMTQVPAHNQTVYLNHIADMTVNAITDIHHYTLTNPSPKNASDKNAQDMTFLQDFLSSHRIKWRYISSLPTFGHIIISKNNKIACFPVQLSSSTSLINLTHAPPSIAQHQTTIYSYLRELLQGCFDPVLLPFRFFRLNIVCNLHLNPKGTVFDDVFDDDEADDDDADDDDDDGDDECEVDDNGEKKNITDAGTSSVNMNDTSETSDVLTSLSTIMQSEQNSTVQISDHMTNDDITQLPSNSPNLPSELPTPLSTPAARQTIDKKSKNNNQLASLPPQLIYSVSLILHTIFHATVHNLTLYHAETEWDNIIVIAQRLCHSIPNSTILHLQTLVLQESNITLNQMSQKHMNSPKIKDILRNNFHKNNLLLEK